MLTKEDIEVLNTFPEDQQEYIRARFSEPVSTMPEKELDLRLLTILKDTFDAAGKFHTNDNVVKEHMFNQSKKDFRSKSKYKFVGIGQVELAAFKGVRREYGDFFSLNLSVFLSWIDKLIQSKDNNDALNAFTVSRVKSEFQTSDSPKTLTIDESKQSCKEYFENYKKTGQMGFFAFAFYEIIKKHLGVKSLLTIDQHKKLIEETKDPFEKDLQEKKGKLEKDGNFKDAEAITQIFIAGIEKNRTLVHKQKALALKYYFDTLISTNKELEI